MDMALRLCATAGTASFTGRSLQIAKPSLQRSSSFAIAVHPLRLQSSVNLNKSSRNSVIVRAAGESVELDVKETGQAGDILPSGEWAENFSLLNYEDLTKHYEPVLFKPEAQPSTHLADVMSKTIYTAFPEQSLQEVDHYFDNISGLPVVDKEHKCIGVLSKKDRAKVRDLKASVKSVMSSPPITLSADKTVSDAAVLMLKNKIHRIPIVNDSNQVVGIVTRTDIFTALEGGEEQQ
jgi:CBS domain-containing protein